MIKNHQQIKKCFQKNHKYDINQYQYEHIEHIEQQFNYNLNNLFSNKWFIWGLLLLCIILIIYFSNNNGNNGDNGQNDYEYELINLKEVISDKLNYLIENNELPLDKLSDLEIELNEFLMDIENDLYSGVSIDCILNILDNIFKNI
jgi:hypothetical protein